MNEDAKIAASLARCQARAAERAKQKAQPAIPAPAPVLPMWPNEVRGVPNPVLRSALFGAIRRGRRTFLQRAIVTSLDGVTIRQTGPRLDQADLDVWEQCLHLSRQHGLGTRIVFHAHAFLRAIGRSTGGKDLEWLKGVIARLGATWVEFEQGKQAYFGPMLLPGARDDTEFAIQMNPDIVALYDADGWTQIQWDQRQALRRQPLAQWLHGFFSTHAAPYPYSVERLRELCGSETEQLFHFRAELRDALTRVAEVTGWTWSIDVGDLLHVRKIPTPTQLRHLNRKSHGKKTTQR